ncbi:MAG: hypothetical protein JWP28_2148 [Phenylobacterium sp.]|jgi:hypothetical protein|nr:hypothetical protein [Phenylobacterium sp.]
MLSLSIPARAAPLFAVPRGTGRPHYYDNKLRHFDLNARLAS